MSMGPNMQNMLDYANANSGWHVLSNDRAAKRACESLTKAGYLTTRDAGNGKIEYTLTSTLKAAKPKAERKAKGEPKAKAEKAPKAPSRFQQAVSLAKANPSITRQDFMKLLQSDLGLSPAGDNTSSSAAMKIAKAETTSGSDV